MTQKEIQIHETDSPGRDVSFSPDGSLREPVVKSTLPVITFEQFMLASDSDSWPMSFVIGLELLGELDVPRLQSALAACALRHPLLFSRLSHDQKHWKHADNTTPHIEIGECCEFPRFDLQTECGLKVFLPSVSANRQTVSFAFHHACTDGLGAFLFLKDLSREYLDGPAAMVKGPGMPLRFLRQFRGSAGRNRWVHTLRWPLDLLGQLWALEMVLNRPKSVEPESPLLSETLHRRDSVPFDPPTAARHGFKKSILTVDQTHQLKMLCKNCRQTINDRIMEAMFRTIESWNVLNNPAAAGELVRLMIPMNLRGANVPTAANMVAMVNFDRRVGRWKSKVWFRRILRWEMLAVKRIRAGVTANRYLQLQRLFGGKWAWLKNEKHCLASCVVSNLGDTSGLFDNQSSIGMQFCGFNLAGLRVRGPLRPRCNLLLCCYTHERQLQFDLTYDATILSELQISSFFKLFVGHLLDD